MRPWEIYTLSDPRDERVRYVGCTHCGDKRLKAHLSDARRGEKGKRNDWIRELLALQLEPQRAVLESGLGNGWESAEKRWIRRFRESDADLTNIADGGQGKPGFKPAASTIALRRAKVLGRKDSPEMRARKSAVRVGMKFSDEHKANISAGKLGKPIGPPWRKRTADCVEAMKRRLTGRKLWPNGRTFSPEWRAKMSAAKLDRPVVFSKDHRRRLSEAAKRSWAEKRSARTS